MKITGWVRRHVLGLDVEPSPATRQFSGPMPIDHMFASMRGLSGTLSRKEALSIPGVAKGRNLLCSTATLPLTERGPGNSSSRAPLLEQIDPNLANVVVLALTLEDLLFDAVSWWLVIERGADNYPTKARRLAPGSVQAKPPTGASWPNPATTPGGIDPTATRVYVDGVERDRRDVIRFDSPNPALNEVARETFRLAADYRDAAAMYARNPQVSEYFSPADGAVELDDDTIREHLSAWLSTRRRGGIGYVPAGLKYNESSAPTAADMKLPELKQQAALETALTMGLDPEVLGVPTTSRTYANAQDWRRDRINDVLAAYMLAITQRLSMPDLCRRGYVRTFDLDDYMKADPITRWTVYEKGIAMRAFGVEHVQAEEGLPVQGAVGEPTGGTPSVTPGPSPAPAGDPADELAARRGRVASFAAPATRTFEFATARFSVDAATRTIHGVALPYGEIASKYGLKFRFAPGSLEWDAANLGRIKFLDSHDYDRRPIGVATDLKNTSSALEASLRVGKGPERDALLEDAVDGIIDGLSVGVEFDEAVDTVPDPDNPGVLLVRRADLKEVSLVAMPAFDGARVTRVAASRDNGGTMHKCPTCGATLELGVAHTCAAPAGAPVTLTAAQFAALFPNGMPGAPAPAPADPGPAVVDPAGPAAPVAVAAVNEPLPYRFVRARPGRPAQFRASEHDFSTDVVNMIKCGDTSGEHTAEGKRVMGFIAAEFDVDSADINEVTPEIQRPDMYVDQRDYKYVLWNAVNKGAPPNGITPFRFPKFSSATGLVAAHVEGTEPTGGTLVTTSQVVAPDGLSGKAYITREVWDMGGNPAVSGLIWNQMVRGYKEALEAATATFIATLTAATDIALTTAAVDDALMDEWDQAVAGLQFVRGYDFDFFAVEQVLYKKFVAAEDSTGRPLAPRLNPMNSNSQSRSRFTTLDLSGVEGVPSWALPSTPGASNNSWLFDSSTMYGWATQPQRLEFEGASDDNATVAPVSKVGIGIWGYKAFANTDIGGVRQVTYDSVA